MVDFHKELLGSVPVRTNDARPEAGALAAAAAADPEVVSRLTSWLREHAGPDQLLVKDPRIFWVPALWRTAAATVGYDLAFLTTLRHPTVVAKSRDSAFLTDESDDVRLRRTTANVAGWVNNTLETELATRGARRAFVRYDDLLADWRSTLTRAGAQVAVDYDADLVAGDRHPIDDFLTTELNRSRVTWDDVDVPSDLREVAERIWTAVNALVEAPDDAEQVARLEQARVEYVRMHHLAAGLAFHETEAREIAVRRQVTQRLNRKHRQALRELRDRS
ncbi:unannotated protein [freshwater metagenome]|uniref:Unannotated protein n=1 Tax=freshwater metagenome TaxID=449393 RepID=A0A6J6QRS4_9ZZZZ